jgi:hypothetical protein
MLQNIGIGKDIFGQDTQGTKVKNSQMALYKTKKLLYIKGSNQQSAEATHKMKEHICKLCI